MVRHTITVMENAGSLAFYAIIFLDLEESYLNERNF